jgi:2-pyrone-4,6-dicarboxylate lactonase
MYLVVIAWMYVVLMMSVAEATNTTGTLLGATVTFLLYGVGPAALVVYLMGAPARNRAIKKRNADELAQNSNSSSTAQQPMTLPLPTFNPAPSRPALRLPPGACDAHVHVFGPAADFPFSPDRNFTPADAPKEALFALHRHLGVSRCVIVQSTLHGFDNSAVEDAIAAGGGHYAGVALVPHDVPDTELSRLKAAGFRGVRFNRLAPLDMHLQVHFESSLIHDLAPVLKSSAVPVVIDHMGRVDAARGPDHADFLALCEVMHNPMFYVKVSGADRISPRPYLAGVALARQLVASFPDRCFWGTDWPHPNHTHVPDDGMLVDLLPAIAPTPDLLDRLLVINPQRFYRFAA